MSEGISRREIFAYVRALFKTIEFSEIVEAFLYQTNLSFVICKLQVLLKLGKILPVIKITDRSVKCVILQKVLLVLQ